MTDLRELLNQVADRPAPPSRLSAGQVFTAGRRRRRGHRLALGAAAAAAALAATAVVVPAATSGPPVQLNVVYAYYTGPKAMADGPRPWQILDPKTGKFRTVDVSSVSQPTTDLRYAAVLPQDQPPADPQKKVGRYESVTGKIRWYDIPVVPDTEAPAISPDGRHIAVLGQGRLIVLDVATGANRSVPDAAASLNGSPGWQYVRDDLAWRSDSRHILLRNLVLDLKGRVVAEQPVPPGTLFRAARPDGPGLLVQMATTDKLEKAENKYGLTDGRGRLVRSADLYADCPGCGYPYGWSGRPDEPVLLSSSGVSTDVWEVYSTNLSGDVRMVHRFPPKTRDFVIAPLTDRSDAPHTAAF